MGSLPGMRVGWSLPPGLASWELLAQQKVEPLSGKSSSRHPQRGLIALTWVLCPALNQRWWPGYKMYMWPCVHWEWEVVSTGLRKEWFSQENQGLSSEEVGDSQENDRGPLCHHTARAQH